MNTDTLPRIQPNDDEPERNRTPRKFLDLSATQLISGALATATAATLGSKLGLAGTITGAVLASLLTALASAVYTASLRKGRQRMKAVVAGSRSRPGAGRAASTAASLPSSSTSSLPGVGPTRADPIVRTSPADPPSQAGRRRSLFAGLRPRALLVGAAAVLLTALAGITGFELLSGHSLSGGGPTTVQQIGGDENGAKKTTPAPAVSVTGTTPAPTPTVTTTASPTSSAPTPSTTSPTPSTTPSASPTPSATSTSGSSQPASSFSPTPSSP